MSAADIEQQLYLQWCAFITNPQYRDIRLGQWFSIHYLKAEDSVTHKFWNATTLEAHRYIIQWLEDHCYTDTLPPKIEEARYGQPINDELLANTVQ